MDADTTGPDADTIGAGGEMKCSHFWQLAMDCLPSIPPEKRWIIIAIGMIIIAILDTDLGILGMLGLMIGSAMLAVA